VSCGKQKVVRGGVAKALFTKSSSPKKNAHEGIRSVSLNLCKKGENALWSGENSVTFKKKVFGIWRIAILLSRGAEKNLGVVLRELLGGGRAAETRKHT